MFTKGAWIVLTELKNGEKVVGAKQVKRAISDGRALGIYLAKNADPAITETTEVLAQDAGLPVCWVDDMRSLGRACGIAVGAAVAAQVR